MSTDTATAAATGAAVDDAGDGTAGAAVAGTQPYPVDPSAPTVVGPGPLTPSPAAAQPQGIQEAAGSAVAGTQPYPVDPSAPTVVGPGAGVGVPLAPTGAGTRPMTWPGISTGTTATVRGGDVTVDTGELDSLATTLTTAADWLDDALTQVQVASAQASAALPPAEPDLGSLTIAPHGTGPATGPSLVPAVIPAPTGASWTVLAPHSPGAAPALSSAFTLELLRSDAINALDALTTGPGSLTDAASRLRDLAADVTATAEVYVGAETAAGQGWTTPAVLGLLSGISAVTALQTDVDEIVVAAVAGAEVLSLDGMLLPDADADLIHALSAVLADENLSDWARQDLLAVAALGVWASQASTDTEGEAIQTYVSQTAARLDPEIRDQLPDRLPHGSGTIDSDELTAVQRVSAYLALTTGASGAARYGTRTGVTVTPHGGSATTVPRDSADPRGLGVDVDPADWPQAAIATPVGAAGLIRASDQLKKDDQDASTGVVSVLRTEHADGTLSWTVLVPGTTDWGAGDSNPQDMLTNLEAVAGMPTDMETAVVTAMQQAGIAPGEEVALYGHSQGAVTAANLAADPTVQERFHVTTLLTAGGPVAGAAVPASVHALHLENAGDAVPGTDGADNPSSPTRMTVTLDTTAAGRSDYPHASSAYADAVDGLGGDPAVDAWNDQLAQVTGAGEEGAQTTQMVFDVERDTPVTTWERTDAAVDTVAGAVVDEVLKAEDAARAGYEAAGETLRAGDAGYAAWGSAAADATRDGLAWLGEHADSGWDGQGQRWRD